MIRAFKIASAATLILISGCSLDESTKLTPVHPALSVIAECNTSIAKMNAARAIEVVFETTRKDSGNQKVHNLTRQENIENLAVLENQYLVCKEYVSQNDTNGLSLIPEWLPEADV